jgi:hypothetical protein
MIDVLSHDGDETASVWPVTSRIENEAFDSEKSRFGTSPKRLDLMFPSLGNRYFREVPYCAGAAGAAGAAGGAP